MDKKIISIIIPCRNEENHLAALFESLDNQKFLIENLEIIFVDGMSNDRTKVLIEEYAITRPHVKILTNPGQIVPKAMNIGIRSAVGELIVRIDAHAEYASDYVAKCLEYSRKIGAENVGGPMRAKGTGLIGKAVELAHHCSFGLGGGRFHDTNYCGFVDTVYLGAFRRSVFDTIGYYDERLVRNQDIELNARIRKSGGRIYLTPEIRSTYKCRSNLGGLWKQNFKNGVWAIYTRALAPYTLSLRHFIPLVFVSFLLFCFIIVGIPNLPFQVRIVPLAAILGSYLAVNLSFAFITAIREGGRYFFILPIVYTTLHLSYGMGSFWGILMLMARQKKQNLG